jgi:hypothetical protein
MAVCHKGHIPLQSQKNLLEEALEFQPHVAVLMFGTNDSKKDQWKGRCDALYVTDYIDVIRRFQALNTTTYIMTPPPVYAPYHFSVDPKQVDRLGQLTTRIAVDTGLAPPIDLFNPLGGEAKTGGHLFCDGVHPVDAGYQIIADTVHEALIRYSPEIRELAIESLHLKHVLAYQRLRQALSKAEHLLAKRKPKAGHDWSRNAKRLQNKVLLLRRQRVVMRQTLQAGDGASGELR